MEINQAISSVRHLVVPTTLPGNDSDTLHLPQPGDERSKRLWRVFRLVTESNTKDMLLDYIVGHLGLMWLVQHATSSMPPYGTIDAESPRGYDDILRVIRALDDAGVVEWLRHQRETDKSNTTFSYTDADDTSSIVDWLVMAVMNHRGLAFDRKIAYLKTLFFIFVGDEGKRLGGWWVEVEDQKTAFKVKGLKKRRQLSVYLWPSETAPSGMFCSRGRHGVGWKVNLYRGPTHIRRMLWYTDGWMMDGGVSGYYTQR